MRWKAGFSLAYPCRIELPSGDLIPPRIASYAKDNEAIWRRESAALVYRYAARGTTYDAEIDDIAERKKRKPRERTSRISASSSLYCSSDILERVMPKPSGYIITPNGKRFEMRPLTERSLRAVFKPYGVEIGYLAFAWNHLHETLSHVFRGVIKSEGSEISTAIWYSTDSDFAQRNMLRAAVSASNLSTLQRDEILWILNKIDIPLRHSRNNAMHAPLMFARGVVEDAISDWMEASVWSASPRAKALRGKELIAEFRSSAELADTLRKYAAQIADALSSSEPQSWPGRPQLPHAHQKKRPKAPSRRKHGKLPPHLREPSQV
jgi:hypothetical protein